MCDPLVRRAFQSAVRFQNHILAEYCGEYDDDHCVMILNRRRLAEFKQWLEDNPEPPSPYERNRGIQ